MEIALPKTKMVLSSKDLTIILPIWGFLYGGSSKTNEEGTPFNIVLESILDINNVNKIPKSTTIKTHKVEIIEEVQPGKIASYENGRYSNK